VGGVMVLPLAVVSFVAAPLLSAIKCEKLAIEKGLQGVRERRRSRWHGRAPGWR
jgi:hypothetical protein